MAELDDKHNLLPSRLNEKAVAYAKEKGAWGISVEDHNFLVEETKRRAVFDQYDQELIAEVRDTHVASTQWTWTNDNDDGDNEVEFVSE